jgi:hypothetical protein
MNLGEHKQGKLVQTDALMGIQQTAKVSTHKVTRRDTTNVRTAICSVGPVKVRSPRNLMVQQLLLLH